MAAVVPFAEKLVLLTSPSTARALLALLAEGRGLYLRNGIRPGDDVEAFITALERLAGTTHGASSTPSQWLTTQQAAVRLGVTERRVVQLCAKGTLRARKHRGRWQVAEVDVDHRAA